MNLLILMVENIAELYKLFKNFLKGHLYIYIYDLIDLPTLFKMDLPTLFKTLSKMEYYAIKVND